MAAALLLLAFGLVIPAKSQGNIARVPGTKRLVLYMPPSGSDSRRCTKSAPCRSFARAFKLASAGALVHVGAGDYKSSWRR